MLKKIKHFFIGDALNPKDKTVFHNLSLIAFFAWVGLGADGLSSSCYGPEEAFLALKGHTYLAIFVALGTVLTIFIISTSYSQIIELFPMGGGGYLVASKLLSPSLGMVSGCALLIDYVLTITISISSGADAFFSFLPPEWHGYRILFALICLSGLTLLNLRGIKESVTLLVPVFIVFVLTHAFVILYSFITHFSDLPFIIQNTALDTKNTISEIGMFGTLFLILKAYSLGAGTFTGIEAVSNGVPILREPKVQTGKRTMRYMSISLAFTVMGLMVAYLLFNVAHVPGKTLNAVLFENLTASWPIEYSKIFIWVTLISEAMILFVAAQAGYLDGPRVISSMALDRWFPSRFTMLSDRFVSQNGILIMGVFAGILMLLTNGSVRFLVVLYSINVFITFVLTQTGMVRHWWEVRHSEKNWLKKLFINGVGLTLSLFILLTVLILKFNEGGWLTILFTGILVGISALIKRHYNNTKELLKRLEVLLLTAGIVSTSEEKINRVPKEPDLNAKTAILLVNGFNGLGLHTLFLIIRLFGTTFKNYIFISVGVLDAGNFKGVSEVEKLQEKVSNDVKQYVKYMNKNGYYSEGFSAIGNDMVEEIVQLAPQVHQRFPNSVFFGGQLVFPKESLFNRLLHNYTVFAIQKKFYHQGFTLVVLPVRV